MNAPVGNRSTAVMARRAPTPDVLDFFPTPPWATRAFLRDVLFARGLASEWMTAWEPAAGEGHMESVLGECFARVHASDVHDYGRGFRIGSFVGIGLDVIEDIGADWIITNPPFNLAAAFAERALEVSHRGVALLVRTAWSEGIDRYERLFRVSPPTHIAQYCERVPMTKGRWDPEATSATAYAWFVWHKATAGGETSFLWIPPAAQIRHSRPDDVRRFAGAAS